MYLPRPSRTAGAFAPDLKRPYQFELPLERCVELVTALKIIADRMKGKYQCHAVYTKPVMRGIKLNIFLLACASDIDSGGGRAPNLKGTTAAEWEQHVTELFNRLEQSLPGCIPYAEEWTSERKFQARFDTYIKYAEF